MTTLASTAALAEYLGQQHDPTDVRALRSLEMASAFIRSYTGQRISASAEDEQELRGNWTPRLWLPQRPVTAVDEIAVRWGHDGAFTTLDEDSYTFTRYGLVLYHGGYWGGDTGTVQVTYDHGYDPVPPDIESACISIASRYQSNPANVVREDIGSYSVTYAERPVSGPAIGLTAYELSVLSAYRAIGMEAW